MEYCQARNSSTVSVYRAQASSSESRPPRTAATTPALRPTTQRLRLAADDPALGTRGRQIRDRQRTTVGPDHVFHPRAVGFIHRLDSQLLTNSRHDDTRPGLKFG